MLNVVLHTEQPNICLSDDHLYHFSSTFSTTQSSLMPTGLPNIFFLIGYYWILKSGSGLTFSDTFSKISASVCDVPS